MALQKRALLATATGVVAPFALPRLLPASASSSPPAGWLSRCHADAGAAGHGCNVANLPDRQRCAAVSHAPAQQLNRDGGSGTEEHPGRTGRHVAADIEQ
jgi:hypothetical protein